MAREIKIKGRDAEQLKDISMDEFYRIIPSNQRRSLKRGLTQRQKNLLKEIKEKPEKFHKTHERDLVIMPEMIGANLGIHNGKEFTRVTIKAEMIGHRLGEFSLTRKRIKHSDPGAGATRGSKHVPLK
jgi:small subunit ribosomal protein S19